MTVLEYAIQKENNINCTSNIREYPESDTRLSDYRNNADRDFARVLYSSSCRRLQGKMQLFIPKENVFYRNRLTHSHEVAQISRIIAQKLKLKDTLTVQTCSLAHDIGNPPFGHAGELFLSNCNPDIQYEGNAQTFRVLNHLEEKNYAYNGLNLTLRTLLGTVKYFNTAAKGSGKFLYDTDFEKVNLWKSSHKIEMRTIDCEIMDLADEITYASHDLEDALKLKYFTIGELLHDFKKSKYNSAYDALAEIVNEARDFASNANSYNPSSEEYAILFRKELCSNIINKLVNDIDVIENGGIYELGYRNHKSLAQGLKILTFNAVNRNSDIIEYEQLGKHILTRLYEVYQDRSYNKDLKLLPADYRELENWERTIIDFIGGMMDSFAISQYERYFGKIENTGIYKKNR